MNGAEQEDDESVTQRVGVGSIGAELNRRVGDDGNPDRSAFDGLADRAQRKKRALGEMVEDRVGVP